MKCEICKKHGYDKLKIKPEEFKVTKKIKARTLEEALSFSPENEWVEVEFTEPVKVKSVLKKAVKH